MPIDTDDLRKIGDNLMNDSPVHGPGVRAVMYNVAEYVETLRRQLHEAHSHNADSERMDWIEHQGHVEYSESSHRSYYVLPRICAKKTGESVMTLRQGIDALRKEKKHE